MGVQQNRGIVPVAKVADDVLREVRRVGLDVPPGYSIANALTAARLVLSRTLNSDKRPVLESCNPDSIYRAMMDMVVQGLNPVKSQCYFIAYGRTLTMLRGYMGSQMVAKSVAPEVRTISAATVHMGEEIEVNIVNGLHHVTKHKQSFASIDQPVVGAYALALDADGRVLYSALMSIAQIHTSWKSSRRNPVLADGSLKPGSVHAQQPGEMAKRTVIQRLCKSIINTTSDARLFDAAARSDEEVGDDFIVREQARAEANSVMIEFDAEPVLPPTPKVDPVAPAQRPEEREVEMPQKSPPVDPNGPATEAQCKRIWELVENMQRQEKWKVAVSVRFGREIDRLEELTADEADLYYAEMVAVYEESVNHGPMPDDDEEEWMQPL